jgi:hypothetical protein
VKVRNALSIGKGERVFDGDHRIRAPLSRSLESALEVVRAWQLKGLNLDPQRPACTLRLLKDNRGVWIGRIPHHRHAGEPGRLRKPITRIFAACCARPANGQLLPLNQQFL